MNEGQVGVRRQAKGDLGAKPLAEVIEMLKEEIESKRAFE